MMMRTKLRENETVVTLTLRHPVTVIFLYASAIASLVLWIWLHKAKMGPYLGYLCLALVIVSLIKTWSRQRDIWVVTDQRVIDEQGIFNIRSMESPLDKITNVTVSQSVPGRVLGYGKIRIQTAGRAGITEEAKVMRPRQLRNSIFEQQESYRERMMRTQAKIEAEQVEQEGETKECPFCAETIKAKAIICRFCNRELSPRGTEKEDSSADVQ
jgi:uncharacterized membrane protein YdbT with pleckstrin-like domain